MQGVSRQFERLDNRNLLLRKFRRKTVFLENGIITPATGTIKLRDDRFIVFDSDLINAVLIAVEREESTVAPKTEAVDGRQNVIWLKLCESQLRFS